MQRDFICQRIKTDAVSIAWICDYTGQSVSEALKPASISQIEMNAFIAKLP